MFHKGIAILQANNQFLTNGLAPYIDKEISITMGASNKEEYVKVLGYIIDYIVASKPVIKADQTLGYHSWILKFVANDHETFVIHEGDKKGQGFIQGVETAIRVVADQEKECEKFGVACIFPTFSQMLVISKGVYEGYPVEGVRYPSPVNMCGWWLSTDLYDGNIKSLMTEHYYHLAFKRPEVLKYLALPFGYRFNLDPNGEVDVWYDEAFSR